MVEQARGTSYTQIVYGADGSKLALTNGQALNKAFIPLPGGAKAIYTSGPTLSRYWHPDWLGSVRLASTPSQTVLGETAYAPYGEAQEFGSGDISFTGQNQDTITSGYSLYDFPMREHHPTAGRWVSPDPAGLGAVDPSNPQSWNRYAYALNNPTTLTDPLGLDSCAAWDPTCGGPCVPGVDNCTSTLACGLGTVCGGPIPGGGGSVGNGLPPVGPGGIGILGGGMGSGPLSGDYGVGLPPLGSCGGLPCEFGNCSTSQGPFGNGYTNVPGPTITPGGIGPDGQPVDFTISLIVPAYEDGLGALSMAGRMAGPPVNKLAVATALARIIHVS